MIKYLYNIFINTCAGVQVSNRRPSVRRVLVLTMHITDYCRIKRHKVCPIPDACLLVMAQRPYRLLGSPETRSLIFLIKNSPEQPGGRLPGLPTTCDQISLKGHQFTYFYTYLSDPLCLVMHAWLVQQHTTILLDSYYQQQLLITF
jgi:hypothetical protein